MDIQNPVPGLLLSSIILPFQEKKQYPVKIEYIKYQVRYLTG
jgi:hypothetical protein